MGEVQIFNNPKFGDIRTSGTADDPMFCLTDICRALGLSASHVKERLSDDVVSTDTIFDKLGRKQNVNFVNEDGLYDVILDSRKPEAKAFRKWVTSEVLPSIRKNGGYSVSAILPDFTNPAEAARAWAEQFEQKMIECKRADEAEQQVQLLKPKAAFCDAVAASNSSCLVGELAKILRQNGIVTGEKRLFEWLRQNGYLGKFGERYNIPNQEYIERGYFELKKGTRSGNGGVLHTTITTKVTTKGQIYFTNLFLRNVTAL